MKRSLSNRDLRRIALECDLPIDRVRLALAMDPSVPPHERQKVEDCARELRYSFSVRDRVAMAANTSIATVNRAYRPDARNKVSNELRAAIERAAARLGYSPDPVARGRRGKASNVIAVCPPPNSMFNPYMSAVLSALAPALEDAGYHAMIAPIMPGHLLPQLALSGVSAGAIVWGGRDTDQQARVLEAAAKPAVLLGPYPGLPGVSTDWELAGYELACRALAGEYDIVHLGESAELPWYIGLQLEGIARALDAHEGSRPQLVTTLDPGVSLQAVASVFRERGLTRAAALLCDGGIQAISRERETLVWHQQAERVRGLLEDISAARAAGQRIALLGQTDYTGFVLRNQLWARDPGFRFGRDIGFAGRDDLEPLFGYADPALTTISYDIPAACRAAVGILERRLRGGPVEKIIVPTRVIVRRSL